MIPSLEGWPTKPKEAPSPHEVRMSPLDINPVFQSLGVFPQIPVTMKCLGLHMQTFTNLHVELTFMVKIAL